MRATNGNTLAGFWYEETLGNVNLSDARWKFSSGTTYELWVKASTYANIAPFVRCTGNGFTSFNTATGSGSAPTGSTAFNTYHRKNIGTINTIRYNPTDTTFHRNIKMDNGYGIDFSATSNSSGTMSSELLEDYEEGTWTPTAYGFTISATYSARYTRIGRICHINCYVQAATGNGTSLQPQISGLPFTSVGGNTYSYGAGRIGTGGYNNSQVDIAFQQQNSSNTVKFYVGGGGINESMMSGGHVIFSLVYEVA